MKHRYPKHNSARCYVRLFHGRHDPDEKLDDWGSDGPVIGPVGVTWTYDHIKLHDPEWEGFEFLPVTKHGLVQYGGKFYGDFEVFFEGDPSISQLRKNGTRFDDYGAFLTYRQ